MAPKSVYGSIIEVKNAEIVWRTITTKPCLIIEPKRVRDSVFDLERTIAGLPLFEQRCPLQKPVLGPFCALQIVFQKKKKKKCDSSLCKIVLKQYFDLNFSRLKVKQEPKFREYDICW